MILHIEEAKYLYDYLIWVRLNNGAEGIVDLKNELYGEVFEPLKNIEIFKSFVLDSSLGTIVWKNGADFAPEFIYEKIKISA
jgi:hypothetical protein